MSRDREEREHAATGIRFAYAGELSFGNRELGAHGAFDDIDAYRCSRCHGLMVESEDEQARHAEEHARVDAIEKYLDEVRMSIGALVDTIEHVAAAATEAKPVGTPQAQLTNDHVRAKRIAAYRGAIEQGRGWRETATGHALEVDAPIGVDAAAWTDSASIREVPPT